MYVALFCMFAIGVATVWVAAAALWKVIERLNEK
jgi:hypothetical protein